MLSLAPDQKMQPGTMYKLSFDVQNSADARLSPTLHASLHGSASVGYTARLSQAMAARVCPPPLLRCFLQGDMLGLRYKSVNFGY